MDVVVFEAAALGQTDHFVVDCLVSLGDFLKPAELQEGSVVLMEVGTALAVAGSLLIWAADMGFPGWTFVLMTRYV